MKFFLKMGFLAIVFSMFTVSSGMDYRTKIIKILDLDEDIHKKRRELEKETPQTDRYERLCFLVSNLTKDRNRLINEVTDEQSAKL